MAVSVNVMNVQTQLRQGEEPEGAGGGGGGGPRGIDIEACSLYWDFNATKRF